MEIFQMKLTDLIEARESNKIEPVEIAEHYQRRIELLNPRYRAFIIYAEDMPGKVWKNEKKKKRSKNLLTGIPVGIKDNIATRDFPTSCASRLKSKKNNRFNAFVVQTIINSGGIIAGKTNLDEFGMVPPDSDDVFLQTLNPWNPEHIPGGSSGGSAAAVAAGLVPAALGSDTGGSVRHPAAHCGVVGFKPTYGLVSRCGLNAFAPSLDQIGPITNSVRDAALLMDIISKVDKNDPRLVRGKRPNYFGDLEQDITDMTFGVAQNYLTRNIDPEIRKIVLAAQEEIKKLGGNIREIQLPEIDPVKITYYIIAHAEVFGCLKGMEKELNGICFVEDGINNRLTEANSSMLGSETKRRILLGGLVMDRIKYYYQALRVRTLIIKKFNSLFETCDFILTPTTSYPPRKIFVRNDPVSEYTSPDFTIAANLTGRPAISLPAGLTEKNLPVGVQLIGDYFKDNLLFQSAHQLEQAFSFPYLVEQKKNQAGQK